MPQPTVDHIWQQLPTWRGRRGGTYLASIVMAIVDRRCNPQYALDLDGTLEIWVLDQSGSLCRPRRWPNGAWQGWWTEMGRDSLVMPRSRGM